jgi:putative phosphoribosyl transferase
MYFVDRPEAGRQLADRLVKYEKNNCVVLALTAGGVIVGVQVSMRLHCHLMLLINGSIYLPGEPEAIGALTDRTFSYSSGISEPELQDITAEFHGVIDQARLTKRHELNQLISAETKVSPSDLKDKTVIVVSDGFDSTLVLDVLADFIKPIRIKKLIIATPISTIKPLDKMHLLADELVVLNVRENIVSIDHHYEQNKLPSHNDLVKIIRNT